MNIFYMYVLQFILCPSERKFFRIYGALPKNIIIIIIIITKVVGLKRFQSILSLVRFAPTNTVLACTVH